MYPAEAGRHGRAHACAPVIWGRMHVRMHVRMRVRMHVRMAHACAPVIWGHASTWGAGGAPQQRVPIAFCSRPVGQHGTGPRGYPRQYTMTMAPCAFVLSAVVAHGSCRRQPFTNHK